MDGFGYRSGGSVGRLREVVAGVDVGADEVVFVVVDHVVVGVEVAGGGVGVVVVVFRH